MWNCCSDKLVVKWLQDWPLTGRRLDDREKIRDLLATTLRSRRSVGDQLAITPRPPREFRISRRVRGIFAIILNSSKTGDHVRDHLRSAVIAEWSRDPPLRPSDDQWRSMAMLIAGWSQRWSPPVWHGHKRFEQFRKVAEILSRLNIEVPNVVVAFFYEYSEGIITLMFPLETTNTHTRQTKALFLKWGFFILTPPPPPRGTYFLMREPANRQLRSLIYIHG